MSALPVDVAAVGGELPAHVFMTYQQDLMASVYRNEVTVAEKSRRTGYSWAAAAVAMLMAAASRQADGSDVLYMGYEKDMTREFIDYVAEWAKAMGKAASEVEEFIWIDPDHPERDIKAFRIKFASGFEVIALPSVPRALRGKQGLVILDEAAFMDDLDAVLTAALAHLMWGGKVLVLSTHNGTENPFNTLINEIRAGKYPTYHLLRCTLDDAIAQGLVKRIFLKTRRVWSPEAEAAWRERIVSSYGDRGDEELFCIPAEGGGVAMPRALIEKRMVADGPVLRWTCPAGFVMLPEADRRAAALAWCETNLKHLLADLDPTLAHVVGQDFARKKDLSVIVPLAILKNLVRRTPFIVELRNVPFEQQRDILFFIIDRLPRFRAGKLDSTGNGAYLGEVTMQKYGELVIEPVQMSEPWYRENMPKLKDAFEGAMIELVRDADILDDIALLRMVRGVIRVEERTLGSDGAGRHGDAAIALALAWAASCADPEVYEYRGGIKMPASPYGNGGDGRRWRDTPDPDEDMPSTGRPGGFLPALRPGAFQ